MRHIMIIEEKVHETNFLASLLMEQFPDTQVIVFDNVQERIEEHIQRNKKDFVITAIPFESHPIVKVEKPFVKITNNKHFDRHKFKPKRYGK